MSNIKQIIIIRKDLKMRRGKECAQAAHASMAWLIKRLQTSQKFGHHTTGGVQYERITLSEVEQDWVTGSFAKICVQVNSESELLAIYHAAVVAGLESNIVEDLGLTEFNGIETFTACAIGPDYAEKIDPITKHLSLY